MNKAISLIVFGLSLMSMLVSAAYAERRLALVVGNSAYEHAAPLKNTTNDAEAVAALFARLGFEVLKGIDLKDREFGRIVGEFSERLD
ncbi:MAG: caspase family protein, partial [Gammaproteobacteria bacterium]|nr:caspase family protein [Gammaproteobacteria bacterium]